MARRKVPQYCRQNGSGQAYVKIDGSRIYLGIYGSPDSHKRYTSEIAKWQSLQDEPPTHLTVSHLAIAYIEHCRAYCRKGIGCRTQVIGHPTKFPDFVRRLSRRLRIVI